MGRRHPGSTQPTPHACPASNCPASNCPASNRPDRCSRRRRRRMGAAAAHSVRCCCYVQGGGGGSGGSGGVRICCSARRPRAACRTYGAPPLNAPRVHCDHGASVRARRLPGRPRMDDPNKCPSTKCPASPLRSRRFRPALLCPPEASRVRGHKSNISSIALTLTI